MKETIKKMARLARLSFPENELDRYTEKVTALLKYVEQLNDLDTKDIEPTSHAVEVKCALRDDVIKEPKSAKDILDQAPRRDGLFYQVPKVIEES